MRRRTFIAGLGSAAVAWPLVASAQQGDRIRRIGVLMPTAESDPEAKARLSGFTQGLADLGWADSRNLRMEVRWAAGNVERMRTFAKELVDLRPEIFLAATTPATAALQRETRTIPIVFVSVSDPVGAAFAASLPRPGGNITGFISEEASVAGKWLELLTEIAPTVKRAAIVAARHALPAMFQFRENALAGGLISYGSNLGYMNHQAGIYTGRILKGEKPANLPVEQATKLELVINLKTAKALGLAIPETLSATADEVIQ
jgi:ABC-type uncharacterized transport system substrate-binding protein